jgi:tetratricopeptide (TPR) repeat protein
MDVPDKLASLLAAADDAPYFPADAYEERRRLFVLRGALLVFLAVAAHPNVALALLGKLAPSGGLQFPWIWTDRHLIAENILLHSLRGLLQFWIHPFTTGRSPLGGTALYLQYLAFGVSYPSRYQLVTLFAHAGNCLLIWVILRRLDVKGAWLAAAIFAVHPIEVQSVAWASRQADVLGTLAGLSSLLAFLKLKGIHPPTPSDFVVSPPALLRLRITTGLLFAVAILFWPSTALLAGIFPLIFWWKRGRLRRQDWVELLPPLLLALMVVCIGLLHSELRDEGGSAAALNIVDRFIIGGRAICFYAESILVPWPVLFVYERWQLSGDLWMLIFPLGIIGAMTLLWWKRAKAGAGPFVAAAAFLILVLPHIPLVRSDWIGFSFVANHLQYLAGVPLIALLAAGLAWLPDRLPAINTRRAIRLAGGSLLIGALCTLAILNTLGYTGEDELWKRVIDAEPMALNARAALSQYHLERKEFLKADQFPEEVQARIERLKSFGGADAGGTIMAQLADAAYLESQRRYSDAILIYQDVLKSDPRNREAALRIGSAYRARGNLPEAIECFREAAEQYPNDELLTEYGSALVQAGRIDDGIEEFREAIRFNPNCIAARIGLSNALFAQHNYPESLHQLQIVIEIDPRNFDAFYSAGVDNWILEHYSVAGTMLEAAVQSRPSSAEAYALLGVVQEKQGFLAEAIDSLSNAVKLKPDFKEASDELAKIRAQRSAPKP